MDKINRKFEWDKLFSNFALNVGYMSRAVRLKVGAVLVKDRRVIAIGYNGTPPGEDNCCEYINEHGQLTTKDTVIHAEANLFKFVKDNDINISETTLYITHSPCPNCCNLITDSGVVEVVYGKKFRDISKLEYLRSVGIVVREFNG